MEKNMEGPERIWVNLAGRNGYGQLTGSWRDGEQDDPSTYCNQRLGITQYIRSDLAAPSAPAEVGYFWLERWRHLPYPNSHKMVSHPDGAWVRHHEAATALTALQAENERLHDLLNGATANLEDATARAEKAEAERDALKANAEALAAQLENCLQVLPTEDKRLCCDGRLCGCYGDTEHSQAEYFARAALAAHAKLKGEV